MLDTLEGMIMELMEQPQNASWPMLVTLLGMEMEVRLEHPQKANPPMLVTVFGMVEFLQPAIRVLEDVSIMALQLFLESYLGFDGSIKMVFNIEQHQKTRLPMLVTLLPMVTEVSPEHPQKASFSMLVTLLGMVMEGRLEQPSKAIRPMLVTLLGMAMEVRPEQAMKAKEPMLVTE